MRTILIALAVALAAGCASTRFSEICNAEMNRCVDTCPRENPSLQNHRQLAPSNLPPSLCEQHCADVGRACQQREERLAREKRSKTPPTPMPTSADSATAQ